MATPCSSRRVVRAARGVLPLTLVAGVLGAQEPPTYPEGSATPASLTARERAWLAANPLRPLAVTPAPTGPVRCVAEYEPMAAIMLAWEGPASWNAIQTAMVREITTHGNADVYLMVDTAAEQTTVQTSLASSGINLARVQFLVVPTDTIWIRDYGPRYVYQGECRAIVDHTYNRPRPNDDAQPRAFANWRRHALYEHRLVHGGGNFHLDAIGRSFATRLIVNENPGLTEAQIHAIWRDYQRVDTTFTMPFPTSVDSTQHIDMWMQIAGDRVVVISDWPLAQNSVQDQICEATATTMAARGYTVFRVPALSVGGVHYTFTNVVLCNGLVLLPSYGDPTASTYNAQAAAVWATVPGVQRVVQVNAQAIVTSAGVLHCIVMHVPAHRGGLEPTAYLVAPDGGEVLAPGARVDIRWVADDDVAVTSVDLLLSRNGGASFDEVIASGIADARTFAWTVPDVRTAQARVRVVVRDAGGRTGADASDRDFAITGAQCTPVNVNYGVGFGAGGAVPTLTSATAPALGSPWVADLHAGRPGASAFVLAGVAPLDVALPRGGRVYAQPDVIVSLVVPPSGALALPFALPDDSRLCGVNLFWQAVLADGALTGGLAMRMGR